MGMIKLSCKSCGAKLELTEDIDRFVCAHCGSEWIVHRGGGIISLKAVEESLREIETSSKATEKHTEILADEVRINRIREKILKKQRKKNRITEKLNKIPDKVIENPAGRSLKIYYAIFSTLAIIITLILAFSFGIEYKTSQFQWDPDHGVFFGCSIIIVIVIVIIIGIIVFNIASEKDEYIVSEEKLQLQNELQRVIDEIKELNMQITNLQKKM